MSSENKPADNSQTGKLGLLRMFAPLVPNLLFKSASHLLSMTPQSQYWDLRTTVTVEFLRAYLGSSKESTTVEETQAASLKGPKLAANTWKVDVQIPVVSEEGEVLEEVVRKVIMELGTPNIEQYIPRVGVHSATGEWIGSRARGKEEREERDEWSEKKKYQAMMEEVEGHEDSGVVLWLHGGAYWMCDPVTHRAIARKIAKSIKGRVFMPRYRLAPQNPFPAALLDALVAYLYLLYPPPGAFHKPIPASKIIIAGDSAGGGLTFSLLQLLLHLHRATEKEDGYEVIPSSTPINSPKQYWRGESRSLPLPSAVVGLSVWCDVSRCFGDQFSFPDGTKGSEEECKTWDYLPTPRLERARVYKPSPAWPEDVGRSHFYAHDQLITHPLVSPLTAKSWKGSPPVWMSVGDECLRDSNLYFAHRLLQSNVSLQFIKFTSMPHVFQGIIPHLAVSRRSFDYLREFMNIVFGRSEKEMKLGQFKVHPVSLKEEVVDREELTLGGLELENILEIMRKEVETWRVKSGVATGKKDVEVAKL